MNNNIFNTFKKRYGKTEVEVQEYLETEEQDVIDKEFFWCKSIRRYFPLTLPHNSSVEDKNTLEYIYQNYVH